MEKFRPAGIWRRSESNVGAMSPDHEVAAWRCWPRKRRAREDEYALFVGGGPLSFVYRLRFQERVAIGVPRTAAERSVRAFEHRALLLAVEVERL